MYVKGRNGCVIYDGVLVGLYTKASVDTADFPANTKQELQTPNYNVRLFIR
jgi:hypothetical protein